MDLFTQLTGTEELSIDATINNIYRSQMEQSQEIPTNSPKKDNLATISIDIAQNGDSNVSINWIEESPEIANLLGELLYAITSGDIKDVSINILKKYAERHIVSKYFIEQIFRAWNKKIQEENRPVISPSIALKIPPNLRGTIENIGNVYNQEDAQ